MNQISDEQLNAYIDGELSTDEQREITSLMDGDESLTLRMTEMLNIKNCIKSAYKEVPIRRNYSPEKSAMNFSSMVAASFVLMVGIFSGWSVHTLLPDSTKLSFNEISDFNPDSEKSNKILLHINTDDNFRIEAALNTTEQLLKSNKNKNGKLKLEIIANAEGLSLLRKGSPYTERINNIVNDYSNVSFLACGFAKKAMELKEGSTIKLIPEAKEVPAALDQIIERLKLGWVYIKA